MRKFVCAALLTGLAGCVAPSADKPPYDIVERPAPPQAATSARMAGVERGPALAGLTIAPADADAALAAFVTSCNWLTSKEDRSGLTQPSDWQTACTSARGWPPARGREFFLQNFETARIGTGEAFATGYFEPEILGSRTRLPGYDVPVYRVPDDLVRAWPAEMPESERSGRMPLGRYDESGAFVPYYDRRDIEEGALAGRGLEFAWAADPIEMFFLQIQGSGLLRLPDGSRMRIGYAGQNGRGYTAIGRVLKDRGAIGGETGYGTGLDGITRWLRDNPAEGREVMRENPSWIFFQELNTTGPLGSLGIPVTRENSVAVDPLFVPYGAPVVLDMDRDIADGLWIAQDTGGAIKGANRFDTFWGNGGDAREIAGGMASSGSALVLLPVSTLARLAGTR